MDGYEMLDLFIKTFGVSSRDAFCYVTIFIAGMMGGFGFLVNFFLDCGLLLAEGIRKLAVWCYKKLRAKKKEP